MSSRKGLSLIEILCVLAILSIVAAILFPVFARAKQAAKESACIPNLKNLYLATALYREEQGTTLEFGDPYSMGLPGPMGMVELLEKTCGKDKDRQSPCGRHPRLDEDYGGYTTIYFLPQDPQEFASYSVKHEGSTPLWVDPNCNAPSTPIRLQYGLKKVYGVMLDGHVISKSKSDKPFWSMSYFE